ncbi:MAG: Flp pilus assembly complex ATPase component TadA [Burkholderiaceae bacterium]|nr:Flp pilus assembly complex ATPase component TadA [Burkholderiaceae bacterium]
MLHALLRFEDGSSSPFQTILPLDIGRAPECGLRLRSWRVAKHHARIEQRPGGVFLEDYGSLGGTLVNGRRVTQHGPLLVDDEIVIGHCLMQIRLLATDPGGSDPATSEYGLAADANLMRVPASADGPGSDAVGMVQRQNEQPMVLAVNSEGTAMSPDALTPEPTTPWQDTLLPHRRRLHGALLKELDLRRRDIATISDAALRGIASHAMQDIIAHDQELPEHLDRQQLLQDVVNEAVGLGPLEPLLADPSVSEIMVNRHDEVFIESAGRLVRYHTGFSSEQAVLSIIERIVSPLGRRIDESSPMVDARLRDGSRVNAVIPPVALRGASLTIRKFPQRRPDMNDLLKVGALDEAMRDFLVACVQQKKNILVSGGTGSGKTTLLNILSNAIPESERIVTIEDAAELRLRHQHLVALESRPANLEGRGQIQIRDLVRNALRMRPDRIVIGECRGAEAFDMLAAMNTGHEGSLTTLHANSPRDALARLETMILMAGMDLPLAAVREHIASSIHIIIQQMRLNDGRRVVTAIVELTGMESGRIQTQELFRYQDQPRPVFSGCGVMPECFPVLPAGISPELFTGHTEVMMGSADFAASETAEG